MDGDGTPNLEQIFAEALEAESPEERAAYLKGACRGDSKLLGRVESLLRAHDRSGSFLEAPAIEASDVRQPREGPGSRIGPYKILQRIGEGGFGVVYMAEQEQPVRRRVALKVIKLGMDTERVIARFEAERQALALLDHPNIARILDAGATEAGRPYFVMELVRGISIQKYCDQNHLTTKERLSLFTLVCRAVQHAHQKGLIHRDLKPSNVLVTLHDGVPVPKIIDFGIARATDRALTDKTLFTEFGQFIGTPEYMSPEQAEMSGLDIDTRTDIYSLGVVLYELLTGKTPLDPERLMKAGYGEIQRIIREEDPVTPSTRVSTLGEELSGLAEKRRTDPSALSRIIRGDLDWIVMKALEKDRTRRYETASELAGDVNRYLASEPVSATPPTVIYKVRKFVRRHRVGVLTGMAIAAALVMGLALATAGLLEAKREAARSQSIADVLQDLLVTTDPEQAVSLDLDATTVVRTAREVFGEDHASVAATLSSRALYLQSIGNLDAAEPLYRESLRIWNQMPGGALPNVATTQSRLGTLLRIKGDERGAEEAFREAIRIFEAQPGERSVAVSTTMTELGSLLQNRGEYGEAAEVFREAVRIRRARAPHQKLEIAVAVNSLAQVMLFAGDDAAAEESIRDALASWRRALPPKSPIMARVLWQIGIFFLRRENIDEAEVLFREASEIYRDLKGPVVLDRRIALLNYAQAVIHRCDGDQEFLLRLNEFAAYVRGIVGDHDSVLGEVLSDFGQYAERRGRLDAALRMDTAAAEIFLETGADALLLERCLAAIRRTSWLIARRSGRPTREYELALRGAEVYLGEMPDEFAVVNTLGVVQYRLGRHQEAVRSLERSDAYYSKECENGVPADVAFLAMARHALGDAEAAAAEMARLDLLMSMPKNAADEEAQAFLTEARLALGSPPEEE